MRLFLRVFGGLCLPKTIDLAARLPDHTPLAFATAISGTWLVAAALLLFGRAIRPAAGALVGLVVVALAISMDMFNQHLGLIGWVALFIAVLDEPLRTFGVKAQLSIVYGFAALAKLNDWFLDGTVLHETAGTRFPLSEGTWIAVAVGVVLIEGWLAVGLWFDRTRRPTAVLGVLTHPAVAVAMTVGFTSGVRMLVFNGLLVAMYLPFFMHPEVRPSWQRRQWYPEPAVAGRA